MDNMDKSNEIDINSMVIPIMMITNHFYHMSRESDDLLMCVCRVGMMIDNYEVMEKSSEIILSSYKELPPEISTPIYNYIHTVLHKTACLISTVVTDEIINNLSDEYRKKLIKIKAITLIYNNQGGGL